MRIPDLTAFVLISLLSVITAAGNDLYVRPIADGCYLHVSTYEFENFGTVSCNGLIYVDSDHNIYIVDTPVSGEQTERLVAYIRENIPGRIHAFIATHWHDDCIGGLEYLHALGIPSYSLGMTIDIADEKRIEAPQYGFDTELEMAGGELICYYPGPGHSLDNIVVWLPENKILFGGCFIKDAGSSSLGNTADGDVASWPTSLRRLQTRFPDIDTVIPGHGKAGGAELLDHTMVLLGEGPER